MPLTEQQHKDLIVLSVGDDSLGTLTDNIDLLWTGHDDTEDLSLHASLTKLDAIDLIMGRARTQVDFKTSSGSSVNLSDLFDHLLKMRATTEDAIAQAQTAAGAGGAVAPLTTTAPITRDHAGQPDPNSRVYRGDPLWRRGRRQP